MTATVLFLCTGNSCRSQMAEGLLRHLRGDAFQAFSAGIETHGLNENAVAVMAEIAIDISGQKSKRVDELAGLEPDFVVTVCGHAHEHCPLFPGKTTTIHAGFADPPALAAEIAARGGGAKEQLDCYRRIRDEIKAFVLAFDPRKA